jgi:hypothetical protein
MAKSQKERDKDSAENKKAMGAEKLSMTTHPGTRRDIDELKERFGFTTKDELFSTLIRNLVAMPKELAAPLLKTLPHTFELTEKWRKKADREANKLRAHAGQLLDLPPDEQEDLLDASYE